PFREAKFQIMYGKGISRVGEIMDMALDNDIVAKSGAWFSFGDIRLGQGKENVKARLETEPELLAAIEEKVMQLLEKNKPVIHSAEEEEIDETEEIGEE
ncbi:MAG: recombinase RecA, partial [Cetobacterium sp.]